MRELYDELLHWSRGVITSAEPDRAELKNALVRADNAMFTSVGDGQAQVRKRYGMTVVNRTPVNNSSGAGPAIVGGTPYKYQSGGATTRYTVVLTSTGRVHLFEDDGAGTDLSSTDLGVILTADVTSLDAAEMNNRLFLLDNRAGQASVLDDAQVDWGVTPPTGLVTAGTGSGSMTGDYDVVVTKWNDDILAESNTTAVSTVTLASQDLRITLDSVPAADSHLYFRVYLRKQSLGGGQWRVLSSVGGESFVGGTVQGFSLADVSPTVTVDIDISDAALADLIIAPPAVNTRGVPPSTAKYAAVFQRRLFLADDSNVYWSELDLPDAFNPLSVEPIASPRGGNITGLLPMADGSGLHIFTETGRHSIRGGADPNSWTIDVEDAELGAVSRGGLAAYRKVVSMWDADHGPVLLASDGGAAYIGTDLIRDNVKQSVLNTGSFHLWQSAALDGRMLFGVVEGGQSRVQRFLVFNVEVGAWESTNWDPMDAASLFVSYDSDGEGHFYLGNYNGQLFRLLDDSSGNDGVRTGTVEGTFVASGTSVSTITDAGATFDTTGAGLRQRRVRLVGPDGQVVQSARIYVSSNTGTALTLSASISGLTDGATYTYLVGGPDFLMETYWGHLGKPFVDKRFDILYNEFRVDEGVANIAIRIAFAWDVNRTVNVASFDQGSSLWDDAEWDISDWDGLTVINRRMSVIKRGFNYRIQLRNPYPNQGFTVLKLAVSARELSDRYAGTAIA